MVESGPPAPSIHARHRTTMYARLLSLLLLPLSSACHSPPEPLVGERRWHFDDVAQGELPAGWRVDATRRVGPLATWECTAAKDAPSTPQALSLSYPNHKQYDSFNLCWTPDVPFLDGTLRVMVCGRSGKEDQGGGLIWRAAGPDDYYVVRLNPLEGNLRLYTVQHGNRSMLASADVPATIGRWYELAVTHTQDLIECRVDGRTLISFADATFQHPGGIGVWTKADAATDFDDLVVTGAPR